MISTLSSTTEQTGPASAGLYDENEPGLILVVEDDASLLKLIEKRLAASGYRTMGVSDGATALAWLNQDSPSLMLLDYSLPDMSGEQLIERLLAQGRHVPFIVATGHGSESVAVEMMNAAPTTTC
jgi:DNA-binding response OmpR family regulator